MDSLNRRGFLGALMAGGAAAKGVAGRLWGQVSGGGRVKSAAAAPAGEALRYASRPLRGRFHPGQLRAMGHSS